MWSRCLAATESHGQAGLLPVQQQQVGGGRVVVAPLGQALLDLGTTASVVNRHLRHTVVVKRRLLRNNGETTLQAEIYVCRADGLNARKGGMGNGVLSSSVLQCWNPKIWNKFLKNKRLTSRQDIGNDVRQYKSTGMWQ